MTAFGVFNRSYRCSAELLFGHGKYGLKPMHSNVSTTFLEAEGWSGDRRRRAVTQAEDSIFSSGERRKKRYYKRLRKIEPVTPFRGYQS